MTNLRLGTTKLPASVVVIICSLCLGLQHGLNYGLGNHNTYLLQGLRLYDSSLFVNDWLVNHSSNYHPLFAYVACVLYSFSPDGYAFPVANVIAIALTSVFIYKIVATLVGDERVLPVYLLTMALVCATETYSVAGSYIFSSTFQPSSIAALGFIAGIFYFLRGKYAPSGVALAIGGAFHVNFLLLGFPLFVLAHLCLGKKGLLLRLTKQLGFSVLALLPVLPLLLEASLSPDAAFGRRVFQEIHAPQHYVPLTYYRQFYPFIAWHLLGIIAGWHLFPQESVKRSFRALFISQLALVVAASLLTTIVFVPSVSQLYFWRLAPLSIMLAQMMGCAGVVKRLAEPDAGGALPRKAVLAAVAAASISVVWYYHYGWHRQLNVWLLIVIASSVLLAGRIRWFGRLPGMRRMRYVSLFAAAIWLFGGLVPFADFKRKSNIITGFPAEEATLYKWARDSTQLDCVFLIPPNLQNFRLQAQRAVVVDWKSTPAVPGELAEWYRRMQTITGVRDLSGKGEAVSGYNLMDETRLERINQAYPFAYAVIETKQDGGHFPHCEIVYENREFVVLKNDWASGTQGKDSASVP